MRPIREGGALVGVAGPPATAVGHGAHPGLWRTPTPYIFIGIGLMMGLIAAALLVLVCTRRKPSGSSRRGSGAAEDDASAREMVPLDREPKVVVIMAGDDLPSFLASDTPLAFPDAVEPPR